MLVSSYSTYITGEKISTRVTSLPVLVISHVRVMVLLFLPYPESVMSAVIRIIKSLLLFFNKQFRVLLSSRDVLTSCKCNTSIVIYHSLVMASRSVNVVNRLLLWSADGLLLWRMNITHYLCYGVLKGGSEAY